MKETFRECGTCGGYHPTGFYGACPDDKNRYNSVLYTYEDLMSEFRMGYDGSDPWGSTMGPLFSVAAEMYFRGAGPPAEWGYSPSPIGGDDPREPDDFMYESLGESTPLALEKFGAFLERLSRFIRRAGKDY